MTVKREIIVQLDADGKNIVLFRPLSEKELPKEGDKNLIAFDSKNKIIWIADLPSEPYDSYFRIKFDSNKLIAWSSNSFLVEIDLKTGKVVDKKVVW